MIVDERGPQAKPEKPRWKRRAQVIGFLVALLAAAASPWWVRPALSTLDFFRVRRVEVTGARYASPDEIVSRLRIDSAASVWDDVGPLEELVNTM